MEIDIYTLAAARSRDVTVIDVRELHEYHAGHVPGARLIPLGELATRVRELGRERVHVICASGNRSLVAARWLRTQGFDAVSVAGGTTEWANAGLPVEVGTST